MSLLVSWILFQVSGCPPTGRGAHSRFLRFNAKDTGEFQDQFVILEHSSMKHMENFKEIRWKQRFENFEKAFLLLERALQIERPSEAERGGIIQFYEMTFELAWKVLKDYLEAEGLVTKSPRETLKTALQVGMIDDGHRWMDALEDRNLMSHTYDEETAALVVEKIRSAYFQLLVQLFHTLSNKLNP
jgi:nucleotidyltransferase substrate binding protein (TIGR01987 family)